MARRSKRGKKRKLDEWELFQASRTVEINLNNKFKFTAEENILKAKSKTLKEMLEGDGDAKSFRLNLPAYEDDKTSVLTFVKFLKAGFIDLTEKDIERKFPQLIVNADYLGCEEILTTLKKSWLTLNVEKMFARKDFQKLIGENQMQMLMKHAKNKSQLTTDRNCKYCETNYPNKIDYPHSFNQDGSCSRCGCSDYKICSSCNSLSHFTVCVDGKKQECGNCDKTEPLPSFKHVEILKKWILQKNAAREWDVKMLLEILTNDGKI